MKAFMRLTSLILAAASLLAVLPARAQLNDGKADPTFEVPPRLDLEYSLAFALDNNFAIRQAKERIRQQEGIVLEVKSAQIPNVSSSAGYQWNAEEISTNGRDTAWAVDVTARQLIYAGGGVTASVRSQKLALEAAVLELKSIINDALFEVRVRYYTVLVNRERIKVQEENVDLLQKQLQDVKNRFDAGTVSNFEVLRAEVALANAQPDLINARNDFRVSIEELRQSLGFVTNSEHNLSRVPEFLGSLEYQPASFDLKSSLVTAREQRPDLQRLVKLNEAAEQGVKAQRAGYQPTVSAFGAYDWRQSPASSTKSSLDGWTVGLQSSWNIFDGRATQGRVVQARSLLEQTKLSLDEAGLSVDVDVRRAISTFQGAIELAEASKKVVEQATEAVRLANARFSAGTATQLDVLQTQVALTDAKLNQLRAYYTYNVSVAATRRAMGLPDELRPSTEVKYP
jgi:outer membrane protein TolC